MAWEAMRSARVRGVQVLGYVGNEIALFDYCTLSLDPSSSKEGEGNQVA